MATTKKLSRGEKRMLFLSIGAACVLAGGGLVYWRNNHVPNVVIPQAAAPRDNALPFFQSAAKALVKPPSGSKIDAHVDVFATTKFGQPDYDRIYPLARKWVFLRQNARALQLIHEGAKRDYLQPPERNGWPPIEYSMFGDFQRLLLVQAHARMQAEKWDDALDSLMTITRLGYQVPRGGDLIAGLRGCSLRTFVIRASWTVIPHLSAAKTKSALQIWQKWQKEKPSAAQSLEELKRAQQSLFLKFIRQGDLRPLFADYGCSIFSPCKPTDEDIETACNAEPRWLQFQLAWMNKTRWVEEFTRCLDWQIAQAKKPYHTRSKKWPFPAYQPGEPIWDATYPQLTRSPNNFTLIDAKEALVMTTLALHAFRLKQGRYPRRLAELVPIYLSRVPNDPFGKNQPLIYKLFPTKYVASTWQKPMTADEIKHMFGASSRYLAPGAVPTKNGPSQPQPTKTTEQFAQTPFTLYSRGFDMRDDGGRAFRSTHNRDFIYPAYQPDETAKSDIVAFVNS